MAGFYTRDDLERLNHQKKYARPLNEIPIESTIAGRDYQNEAIRRVTEGIDAAKRKFLLVMATGRRIHNGQNRYTQAEVQNYIQDWKDDLIPTEPHNEVHSLLSNALLEPSRLAAWATELNLL